MQEPTSTSKAATIEWIAVDWGTSSLRCWAMQGGTVTASAQSNQGMSQVAAGGFEQALLALIDPWLEPNGCTPVLACGMVGAKQGWLEAPYRAAPCDAVSKNALTIVPVTDSRIAMHIVPGISQQTPADVMRGEETLIAGLLAENVQFNGVVCMPGTHCKWVEVNNATIHRFKTVLTGELFELLSSQSVLRFDTNTSDAKQPINNDVFVSAVLEHTANPTELTAKLFSIRAQALLSKPSPVDSTSRLSGLLIAADVTSMQDYWHGIIV